MLRINHEKLDYLLTYISSFILNTSFEDNNIMFIFIIMGIVGVLVNISSTFIIIGKYDIRRKNIGKINKKLIGEKISIKKEKIKDILDSIFYDLMPIEKNLEYFYENNIPIESVFRMEDHQLQDYFKEDFTAISPEAKEQIMNLNISNEEKFTILEEFKNVSVERQNEFLKKLDENEGIEDILDSIFYNLMTIDKKLEYLYEKNIPIDFIFRIEDYPLQDYSEDDFIGISPIAKEQIMNLKISIEIKLAILEEFENMSVERQNEFLKKLDKNEISIEIEGVNDILNSIFYDLMSIEKKLEYLYKNNIPIESIFKMEDDLLQDYFEEDFTGISLEAKEKIMNLNISDEVKLAILEEFKNISVEHQNEFLKKLDEN